jgi:uncharacterized membrane protein YhaH (DUF805 family)
MFKKPFSFKGRIRRKEYGLSVVILYAAIIALDLILLSFFSFKNPKQSGTIEFIFLGFAIPMYWFMFAQGAKRCHDMGKSGWWQLIPFFVLWMLFQKGKPGMNKYGLDPKNPYGDQFSFETGPVAEMQS